MMTVFKILLIILVSAPVIGFALYFYSQMLDFIKVRNKAEEDQLKAESRIRPERQAAGSSKKRKAGQKNSKGGKPQSSQKPAKGKKAKGSAAKKEKRQ